MCYLQSKCHRATCVACLRLFQLDTLAQHFFVLRSERVESLRRHQSILNQYELTKHCLLYSQHAQYRTHRRLYTSNTINRQLNQVRILYLQTEKRAISRLVPSIWMSCWRCCGYIIPAFFRAVCMYSVQPSFDVKCNTYIISNVHIFVMLYIHC